MTALSPLSSAAFWGGAELLKRRLGRRTHQGALYVPRGAPGWGLYDAEGRVIEAAIDRWGPDGASLQQEVAETAPEAALSNAPLDPGSYVYIGRDNLQYGHFLVETLCRCWTAAGRRGVKLLVHGGGLAKAWGGWGGHAFAAEMIERLGYAREDVVHFDAPTRIREVEVCEPALRQQAYAHPEFRRLCLRLGDADVGIAGRLARTLQPVAAAPIWLSRTAIYSGTMTVVNERDFETALRRHGFDVTSPELLPLGEQIALFRQRRVLAGFVGSAFHTGIFSRRQPKRILLSVDGSVNSNFALFDKLGGSAAEYRGVETDLLEDLGPGHVGTDSQRFTRTFALRRPHAVADALAALAEA